jgi:hypothetical protein
MLSVLISLQEFSEICNQLFFTRFNLSTGSFSQSCQFCQEEPVLLLVSAYYLVLLRPAPPAFRTGSGPGSLSALSFVLGIHDFLRNKCRLLRTATFTRQREAKIFL